MKVFLAGAAGAIGRRLTPLLLDAGHDVYGTTRNAARAAELERIGAHALVVDVFDAQALSDCMAAAGPQVVIHQLTDLPSRVEESRSKEAQDRNARIRTEGTKNLVEAALACSAHLMIAQSIGFVYAPGPQPHDEDDPLAPDRGSVVTLERLVTQSPPLEGIVLRYGFLYGPGTWYSEPQGDFTVHVDAAAHAVLLAIDRAASGVYNVGDPSGYASSAKAHEILRWDHRFRLRRRPSTSL